MLKCPIGRAIDFASFTFSGSSAIDDAMITLAGAGRTIRGAVDRGQAQPTAEWPAMRWLVEAGIDVRVPGTGSSVRKLHHKLMVIDRSTEIGGSFNYTEPAQLYNDEVLLVLGSPHAESEGVQVDKDECRRLAEHTGTKIDRILPCPSGGRLPRWRGDSNAGPNQVARPPHGLSDGADGHAGARGGPG
jgi:phosphatidylserine/phosphatidylglycerophosphate/cardiolipin synthase-like enzyme